MDAELKQTIKGGQKSICPLCYHFDVCRGVVNQPCIECDKFVDLGEIHHVVHGKWVYNDGDNIPYCSECMMPQDSECNFCPSCGADMRN